MAELWTSTPENDFIASMQFARTHGDLDTAVSRHLTMAQARELHDALVICKRYGRIMLRDNVLIAALDSYIHTTEERDANRGGEDDCPAGEEDGYNRGF